MSSATPNSIVAILFGYYEHKFKIAPDGRFLLSQTAKEKLNVDDEELENRFQTCQRMLRHVAHAFIRVGNHSFKSIFGNGSGDAGRQVGVPFRELSSMHSKNWGFLMALMALINSPELVDAGSSHRAGTNRAVGAKMVPYLEHRILKLRLTRKSAVDRALRTLVGRLPPRRHGVDGHWRRSPRPGDDGANCEHAWVPVTQNRQNCAICSSLRSWVNSYERGDESRGRIITDRLVTKS